MILEITKAYSIDIPCFLRPWHREPRIKALPPGHVEVTGRQDRVPLLAPARKIIPFDDENRQGRLGMTGKY